MNDQNSRAALAIDQLTPAEIEVADQLLVAAYGMASRRAELERYLALQPEGWIMARWEGQPAGAAGATVYGPTAYIGLVGVDPAFQRRGIADALMTALIDRAENWMQMTRLELEVYVDNAPAIALYRKHGFVEEGRLRSYAFRDGAYVDVYPMARLKPAQRAG